MNSIPHSNSICQVKTYPDLSAAAIQQGCDLSLRLWYVGRQEQPDGRGWLWLTDVYRLSPGSKRQTTRWLREGEGQFWNVVEDRDGQKVRLKGLDKVEMALGVLGRKSPVYVPLADGIKDWRSNLYASFFAGEKFTQMNQEKLSGLFGRSRPTLCEWSKNEALEVRHNAAWEPYSGHPEDYDAGILKALGIKDDEGDDTRNYWLEHWDQYPDDKKWMYRRGDKHAVCWTLPNGYKCAFETGPRTTLQKRAKREVHRTLGMGRGSPMDFLKLFYEDPNAAARALQEPDRPEPLYYKTGAIHWGKRHLWEHCSRATVERQPQAEQPGSLQWTRRISPWTGCLYYDC